MQIELQYFEVRVGAWLRPPVPQMEIPMASEVQLAVQEVLARTSLDSRPRHLDLLSVHAISVGPTSETGAENYEGLTWPIAGAKPLHAR